MIGTDRLLNTHVFYLLSENKLQDYIKVAEENHASSPLLDQLLKRKKIPVFLKDSNKNIPVQKWSEILSKVSGEFEFNNGIYYYCFV